MTLQHRFWAKVAQTGNVCECWEWTASTDGKGYGKISVGGKLTPAHRFSYEQVHGRIEDGKQLDHLCRNRLCVNPAHLEVVTCRENIRRGIPFANNHAKGWLRNKTHCKNGHRFSSANTYRNGTKRSCRKCHAAYEKARRASLREGRK